jgi:hypothetical protein
LSLHRIAHDRRFYRSIRDPATKAVVAAVGWPPLRELRAVDFLLGALRSTGLLSAMGSIYWGYTAHLGLFRCDLLHPGDANYTLSPVNGPLEPPSVPYAGYSDDGTGRGWTAAVNAGSQANYSQNSAHVGAYWLGGTRSNNPAVGFGNSASPAAYVVNWRSASNTARARINDATDDDLNNTVPTTIVGHRMHYRSASNLRRLCIDGFVDSDSPQASTGVPTGPLKIMFNVGGNAASSTQSLGIVHVGSGALEGLESRLVSIQREALLRAGAAV